MTNDHELRRTWRERAKWLGGTLTFCILGYLIFKDGSINRYFLLSFLLFSIFSLLSAWGTWQSFSKPDVKIVSGKIYLFDLPLSSPVVLPLSEIRAIKRHIRTPVLRVSPLIFYLANGRAIKFSTGTSEQRMIRIIKFIEPELGQKIEITRTTP